MKTNNQHKKAFKLENLSKKETFSVPDGYFNTLPTIIQSKAIESTKKAFVLSTGFVLKFALPSILLLLVASYWGYQHQIGNQAASTNIELMLADISTVEMVEYLDQTDLSSDDFLELVSFEGEQIDDFSTDLENITDEELDLLMNDFTIEELENI